MKTIAITTKLVMLTYVSAEGDNVEALLAEPFEDYGGVKTARVGEDYFRFGFAGHDGLNCC